MFSQLEFKHLRHSIRASVSQMAGLLGFQGKNASQKIRAIESGKEMASLPVQRLAKYMQQGVSLGVMTDGVLPEFMLCSDMVSDNQDEWVFHTRYPRFLAIVTDHPIDGLTCASADNIEWISVALWIDEPVGDPLVIVKKSAAVFSQYTKTSME